MIRRLRVNNASVDRIAIKDKNGNMLTNSEDQLKRWKEYFHEMFNVETVADPSILQQIPIPHIDQQEQD